MSGFLTKLAGVKRELLDTVKARKLAYCGNTMSKQGHYSNFVFAKSSQSQQTFAILVASCLFPRVSFLGQQNVGRIFS